MANGRYETNKPRRRRHYKRKSALLLSLVLLLGTVFTGTLAYLVADRVFVTNTFVPGHVDCEVTNTSTDNGHTFTVKPDNETNTDVYLRVAIVATWGDDQDIHYAAPQISVSGNNWSVDSDGYYYYQLKVSPGGQAEPFTVTTTETSPVDGYKFQVRVLAEAIQADPGSGPFWNNAKK